MSYRLVCLAAGAWMLLGFTGFETSVAAQSEPADARERAFIQGLRERGYHDLSRDYLTELRGRAELTEAFKQALDFEEGKSLLDEATDLEDLDRRRVILEQARAKLDGFVKANPGHPQVPEALVQVARLLFERGLTSAIQAADEQVAKAKDSQLEQARAAFGDSRKAYDQAVVELKKIYDTFPRFIPEGDPRRNDRDRAHLSLMDAELQRALVDYEEAQTHPLGSEPRNVLLDQAREAFQGVYNRYRTQLAGFFAHMWEGKCFEEKGELGAAMGVYKELMEHPDPTLGPLKRKVMYFQIIVDGKRGEHSLAADRAGAWLQQFPNAVGTDEGAGVRFELSKNLLLQAEKSSGDAKQQMTDKALELLTDVVRYYSPFKPQAIELLKKYRPAAALNANAISGLSYQDAFDQAQAAIATREWDRASALLQQAVRRADPAKDPERANQARYLMAYCEFEAGRYYESAVLAEHLARRYPSSGQAAQAASIGMAAWTNAYNTMTGVDRQSDLENLVDLARYTTEAFTGTEQGDASQVALGEIALGRGLYRDAAAAFEGVREVSPRYLDSLVRAGDAHWRLGLLLKSQGKDVEFQAESKKAEELMQQALAVRRERKASANDPGLLLNLGAMAEIYRATGRHQEAIDLISPAIEGLGEGPVSPELSSQRKSLLVVKLRSQIALGKADAAIADMKRIEKLEAGKRSGLTLLYYELGRSLQKELDELALLQDAESRKRAEQTKAAYTQFLQSLASLEEDQTYDSLTFAAEALLDLGQAKEAQAVLDRMEAKFAKLTEFQPASDRANRLVSIRLKRVKAMRMLGQFAQAQALLDEVKKIAPRLLDQLLEQGYLLEDWAVAEPKRWKAAFTHWQNFSGQLQRLPGRQLEYFDAIYHVALALEGMKQTAKAAAVLKSVMTLTPSVGSPEMKAKYEALLKKLGY